MKQKPRSESIKCLHASSASFDLPLPVLPVVGSLLQGRQLGREGISALLVQRGLTTEQVGVQFLLVGLADHAFVVVQLPIELRDLLFQVLELRRLAARRLRSRTLR